MSEKAISKHLIHLEKQFATNNPVLQQATKLFHELDQLEFDLSLLDPDETTARKISWWPIITLIAPESLSKTHFINQFLGSPSQAANVHSAGHKFTVFQHTPQTTLATLPGTALDVDYRLPFYKVSQKLEAFSAGEGAKINAYLELKTLNSNRLKNRLFIETPDFNSPAQHIACDTLNKHVIELSDLVLIFTDVFETESVAKEQLLAALIAHQDSNKFMFVIDHADIALTPEREQVSITTWRRRLSDLGVNTGQFMVLANSESPAQNKVLLEIDQRLQGIDNDRSYRVLYELEKSIRDIPSIIVPEVASVVTRWKERCNFSTLIVIGFIISLLLFAEIYMGILDVLFDPIIGSIAILGLIAVLIPLHVLISRLQAKSFIKELNKRQKELQLTENLAAMFERSLSFWRIVLPINEPIGSTKKYRARLRLLGERVKDLVQTLNDNFSVDNRYDTFTPDE
ncbi:MAG: hypothetical protein QX197_14630 [Methylococcaceae bacterium]